ncbi:hypothetical protein L6452_38610 [Arctium lappa]|uniref:Uncharacterized protein n=1 Tax=Arctium lappa TaxID=4217 RepID=A0ACB8XQK1_ARCLA|nr:hypothetical protein L6452_38610 [Arctium lappa]
MNAYNVGGASASAAAPLPSPVVLPTLAAPLHDDPERKLVELYDPWLSDNYVGDSFTYSDTKKEWKVEELGDDPTGSKTADVCAVHSADSVFDKNLRSPSPSQAKIALDWRLLSPTWFRKGYQIVITISSAPLL